MLIIALVLVMRYPAWLGIPMAPSEPLPTWVFWSLLVEGKRTISWDQVGVNHRFLLVFIKKPLQYIEASSRTWLHSQARNHHKQCGTPATFQLNLLNKKEEEVLTIVRTAWQ